MKNARELMLVHLCSLLAPTALLCLHVLLPGGFLESPLLTFTLLSVLLSVVTPLTPHLVAYFFPLGRYTKCKFEASLRSLAPAYTVSVAIYVAVGVLLGANPLSQLFSTLVWSSLMTSLTFLPAFLVVGISWRDCIRVIIHRIFENAAERAFYVMFVATITGAWLGAVPIPLDWNRPWQVWPIPCSCGAVAGSVVGTLLSLVAHHHSLYPEQLRLTPRRVTF